MNQFEKQMITILTELKENHGAVGIRAAFESEGARMEELLRLKEVSARTGLGLNLIIGGCESIRDMIESRAVGVRVLAAPMIESDYALRKYLQAVAQVFPAEEREHIEIHANIESITGIRNLDKILNNNKHGNLEGLAGIIVERVDLCHSQDLKSDSIDEKSINEQVTVALHAARAKGLLTTVGGGVSANSLPFFKQLPPGLMSRFETRKVVFDASVAIKNQPERGIMAALAFELFYLKNKLTYSRRIKNADLERMNFLERAYWKTISMTIPAGVSQ